ncbi:hypothetical protein OIU34_26785 [Pararhizobium sp. BT-229]|uniref:calcium-binding protein n=1 Tax=Pararhizobium sp. BT-229 TaxID=2986923 RepID=UPI0021F6FC16|nr:calcium-binding protein [Pararhizobium sp. BT-229]MCV9965489.1 hypothetical protein [Pararhizobium sp. BT-229]
MTKFTGTNGKDDFIGGAANDVFVFNTDHLASSDRISGGGGTDVLALFNTGPLWDGVSSSQWRGLSSIEGVVLMSQATTAGFKLSFDDTFFTHNKVKNFEIFAGGMTGFAQGVHVEASAVTNMAFEIVGTLKASDRLKTGTGNDTFAYTKNALDVADVINGGGGFNTLVLAGAGETIKVRDGVTRELPDGHTYLADVRNIDKIVVTDLDAGQSRSIGFGNLVGTARYMGTGVVEITTDKNYGTSKAAAPISGKLIVDGERLTSTQSLNVTGGNAADRIEAGAGNDRLRGGAGNDVLSGAKGNDALSGDSGNDVLAGGLGADTMSGGLGQDVFTIGDARQGSSAAQFYKDKISGGAGTDTLAFTASGNVNISAAELASNTVTGIEVVKFSGAAQNAIALSQTFLSSNHDTNGLLHLVNGSMATDGRLTGFSVDASKITSTSLAVDVEIHGRGKDILKGGAGNDFFDFAGASDSGAGAEDIVSGGGGKDTILIHEGATASLGAGISSMEIVKIVVESRVTGSSTGLGIATKDGLIIDGRALGANEGLDATGYIFDPTTMTQRDATGKLVMYGGKGADTLIGGVASDAISGGSGSDALFGRKGADVLTGGAGDDLFMFAAASDSTVAASGRDTITDFSRAQGDQIYFLHASSTRFDFIGDDAFGHHAGEVRSTVGSTTTTVQLDQNGDGTADFQLILNGRITLAASDFVL